jgi:hypothetical protein
MITTRLKGDGTVVEILRDGSERPLTQQVDWSRIDATTEDEIAAQFAQDEADAMRDAAASARRVRRKVGLSQIAFARRIGVPSIRCATGNRASARRRDPPRHCCESSTAPRRRRSGSWATGGVDRDRIRSATAAPWHGNCRRGKPRLWISRPAGSGDSRPGCAMAQLPVTG